MFSLSRILLTSLMCLVGVLWIGGMGAGCTDETPKGAAVIGATGGKVSSADGKLTLEIPAGALSSDTTISVTLAPPVAGDTNTLALSYTMKPDGLTFAKPVTASLQLAAADLPGVDLSKENPAIYLYTKSGDTVEGLKEVAVTIPTAGGLLLTGQLSHFSDLRVALGFYTFVIEGVAGTVTMQVGEIRSFKAYAKQRGTIPAKITSLLQIHQFWPIISSATNVNIPVKLLGPEQRGSRYRVPYNQTIGNVLKLTDQSKEAIFAAVPSLIFECIRPGPANVRVSLDLRESLLSDGKILPKDQNDFAKVVDSNNVTSTTDRSGGFAELKFQIDCVASTTQLPAPSDGTVNQARHLKRRASGDIIVIGEEGSALHDGETAKRKGIIHLGDGIIDEAGADFGEEEDFSVILKPDPATPDAKAGKVVPEVQKSDGTTKELKLDKETLSKSFIEIKPICPAEKDKPCKTTQFSLVDAEGALYRLGIDVKTLATTLTPITLAEVDKVATAELRQTTTGYKGMVVSRGSDVVAFQIDGATAPIVEVAGAAKPGNFVLACNALATYCAVGNTDTSELFFFGEDPATNKIKLLWSEQAREAFNAIDLIQKVQEELAILLTHPQRNAVTKVDVDKAGIKMGLRLIQTECAGLRVAVFAKGGEHYIAACDVDKRSVLLRRDFTDRMPAERVTPPQERTPPEDNGNDAGPPEQPVTPEPKPDHNVDCSKYSFTGTDRTYPKWYAGTIEGPVCAAMYDKLYGRNGQDINCKTDADCKNPCRYICCGQGLQLELIVCIEGQCRGAIGSKCDFCDGTSTGFGGCGLPPEYKP